MNNVTDATKKTYRWWKVQILMQNAQQLCGMSFYGFSGTVGADDESEGLEEGDDVLVFRVEAPDALYQHFVYSTHLF